MWETVISTYVTVRTSGLSQDIICLSYTESTGMPPLLIFTNMQNFMFSCCSGGSIFLLCNLSCCAVLTCHTCWSVGSWTFLLYVWGLACLSGSSLPITTLAVFASVQEHLETHIFISMVYVCTTEWCMGKLNNRNVSFYNQILLRWIFILKAVLHLQKYRHL
jgi:hypothetical protein